LSSVTNQPEVSPEAAAAQQLMQLSTGYIASTCLYLAVKLRIPDRLASSPRTAADLANELSVDEDALFRVLRTLTSLGVFEEGAPRTFANNLASSMVRSGTTGSMYEMALWMSDPFHFAVYADAMYSLQTGRPAIEKTFGMPVFEYFPKHPDESEVFNNAMTMFSGMVIPAVLEVYDFSGIGTLVDVAGGHGRVLTSILEKYPDINGVLFDLEHVLAGARTLIDSRHLAGRCRTIAGDFFKGVPDGADAYIMKHIIHDWDDQRATVILKNIRAAMNRGGRLILLESVVAAGSQPDFAKLIDLEMLLLPGGRERTEQEFRDLLSAAGFTLTRIVPTKSPLSVIEAK
jgi:O-methyltransferase domain/Dimerisation domain